MAAKAAWVVKKLDRAERQQRTRVGQATIRMATKAGRRGGQTSRPTEARAIGNLTWAGEHRYAAMQVLGR